MKQRENDAAAGCHLLRYCHHFEQPAAGSVGISGANSMVFDVTVISDPQALPHR
jgi:hypothetical protein